MLAFRLTQGCPPIGGVGGLYDGVDTEDGVQIEDALSGPMFANRPEVTWKYLWQIGASCVGAVPNAAHRIIAEIESEKRDVWVITQNVDGFHRAAGSKNLIEVHGHMYDLYCTQCGCESSATELLADFRDPPRLPPICNKCNGVIRPNVVLFDEMLPLGVIQGLNDLSRREFDLVFVVGTSAAFPYIQQPLNLAQSRNTPTVEINPMQTEISWSCRYHIRLGAADALQQIRTGIE